MGKRSRQLDAPDKRRGIGPFWLGILTGMLVTAAVFHRKILEFLGDATGNVLPVIFMPGLLELTIGLIGLAIVIVVNYLLRREQSDEWICLDEGEDDCSRKEDE
ncbi:MAG: hypothetical protein VCA55_11470 [Verrucomicrobiales bacterium]|jgi:hypothetical protein